MEKLDLDTLRQIKELKEAGDPEGLRRTQRLLTGKTFNDILLALVWVNIDELVDAVDIQT